MSSKDVTSAAAESGTATTMVETDGGETMGATTTNQTELVTKKMVQKHLVSTLVPMQRHGAKAFSVSTKLDLLE